MCIRDRPDKKEAYEQHERAEYHNDAFVDVLWNKLDHYTCWDIKDWEDCEERANLERCEVKINESRCKHWFHPGVRKVAQGCRARSESESRMADQGPCRRLPYHRNIITTAPLC